MALSRACRQRLGLRVAGGSSCCSKSYAFMFQAGRWLGPAMTPSGITATRPRRASSKSESLAGGRVLLNASLAARVAGSASFCCAVAETNNESDTAPARTPMRTIAVLELRFTSIASLRHVERRDRLAAPSSEGEFIRPDIEQKRHITQSTNI